MINIKRTIEYGLYLLVFLLPWQTRWIIRAGELGGIYFEPKTISLYGTDILLAIVILLNCYIVIKRLKANSYKLTAIWWLFAGLDLFIFISIFFAQDKAIAIEHYVWFLLGVGLFWLITHTEYKKVKLLWAFLAGVVLQAVLGAWQFLSQSTFASKWLGMAAHNPNALGTSVIETLNGERWLRAYGALEHPNVLGGLLVTSLLVIFFCHSERSEESHLNIISRDPSLRFTPLRMTLIVAIYCLLFTSLFFTFSRTAWLGLAVALIVISVGALVRRNKSELITTAKTIFITILLFSVLGNIYGQLLQPRLAANTRLEAKSIQERASDLSDAQNLIKSHWLLGAGVGHYTLALIQIHPNLSSYSYQAVHNTYLLVWSEIGIVGFLLFSLIIFYFIFYSRKQKNYISSAIMLSIAIMMLLDHWWWSSHFGLILLFFIFGILYNNQKTKL